MSDVRGLSQGNPKNLDRIQCTGCVDLCDRCVIQIKTSQRLRSCLLRLSLLSCRKNVQFQGVTRLSVGESAFLSRTISRVYLWTYYNLRFTVAPADAFRSVWRIGKDASHDFSC